ncbi:LOW QUALITY PROTEIN: cuticle protein 67-like [Zootermopsis nevadensis]|uniref:LOW QUALITY PROTEIN: cuticle protein 67-like n=1 Tax=Zootermopsis nevadensis TaxID=136037 RepID=UPI000B8E8D13|nr:LOW QUALITY PROTEIN: cuticle protein 67-like [Zootermopsis nevadensis]
MAAKFILLAALVAIANAGYLGASYAAAPAVGYAAAPAISYAAPAAVATPAITSQHSNILRSYGNLGQVSTYSKTIDTPFSSVRKSDYGAYAAPALAAKAYHTAPIAAAYAAPVVKTAATAVAGHGLLGVAYSAAPAVAHMTYSNGLGIAYSY